MNQQEAQAAIAKYGSQTKAARALRVSRHKISAALQGAVTGSTNKPIATVHAPIVGTQSTPSQTIAGGFILRNTRLFSRKPADSLRSRFYKLRRDMGYPVETLAKQWGVSEETLRKHARDVDCLKFTETNPGEFIAIVVHPETGKAAKEQENAI